MTQRSLEAWKSWKDAQLKYDYYIIGLVAALFAYIGNNYTPEKIAFSQNTFELLAIIFLAVSLLAGVKRLENDLSIQTITLKQCEAKEIQDVANKIVAYGGSNNLDTGGFITASEAKERAILMQSSIENLNTYFNERSQVGSWLFRIRNWTLILGLMSLALSKVIGVYNI